jgi:hypothetical protein
MGVRLARGLVEDPPGGRFSPSAAPEKGVAAAGRILAEVAIATGLGAVAVLGVLAIVVAARRLDRATAELALARRAAEARLSELAALDDEAFRASLAGGDAAAILRLDVPGLAPPSVGEPVGRVTIDPAPGDPRFERAALFRVRIALAWRSETGRAHLVLEALLRPERDGGAP